jgi:hypothetical protein
MAVGLIAIGCVCFSAARAGDLDSWLAARGTAIFQDDFADGIIPPHWKAGGRAGWTAADATLHSPAEAVHGSGLSTRLDATNVVVRLDFRLGASKSASLYLNEVEAGKSRHICHVTLTPAGFSVIRDGAKSGGSNGPRQLGKVQIPLDTAAWHSLLVEVVGDEILVRVDEQHFVLGQDARLAHAKDNLLLGTRGGTMFVDNVRAWHAAPNPGWAALKAHLLADKARRKDK